MEKWPLPQGWEWKTLAEISEINPRRPSIQRSDDTPTSFVPMAAVDEVEGRFAEVQKRPYREIRRGYTYFEENDVVFAKITPCMENGKSAIARGLLDGFGFGTTEFHVLRPKSGVLPEWIHRYVRQMGFRLEAKGHFRGAVGQQRVPQDFLEGFHIPLPNPDDPVRSLETQRRIVARLDALLTELAEARRLHAAIGTDTGRIMEAVLGEVFSPDETSLWPDEDKLARQVEITAALVDPTLPEYRNLPHVHGGVIEEATGRLLECRTAAEDGMRSGKYHFKAGSVLYSKIRPYLRKVTIAQFEGLCSADMYPLEVKDERLVPEFLLWALLSPDFTRYAESLSGRARMPKLNREQVFGYSMRFPERDAQHAIAARLKDVQSEIVEMQRTQVDDAALLDEMEQAILAQAFRGEL